MASTSRHRLIPWLLLIPIALAAVAVGYWTTSSNQSSSGQARSATISAVRDYQFAVDHLLETGDVEPLNRTLAPEFVEHQPPAGIPPTTAGLATMLTALRESAPGIALKWEIREVLGNQATVSVIASAPGETDWQFEERLRFDHNQLTERWGALIPFPLVLSSTEWATGSKNSFSAEALPVNAPTQFLLISASAERIWPEGATVFLVQSGAAQVRSITGVTVVPSGGDPIITSDTSLGPGDLMIADGGFLLSPTQTMQIVVLTAVESQMALGGPPGPEPARQTGPDGAIMSGEAASIQPLLALADQPMRELVSVDRQQLSLETGVALPPLDQADFAVVLIESNDLEDPTSGQLFGAGTVLVLDGATDSTLVAAQPATVTMVFYDFGDR